MEVMTESAIVRDILICWAFLREVSPISCRKVAIGGPNVLEIVEGTALDMDVDRGGDYTTTARRLAFDVLGRTLHTCNGGKGSGEETEDERAEYMHTELWMFEVAIAVNSGWNDVCPHPVCLLYIARACGRMTKMACVSTRTERLDADPGTYSEQSISCLQFDRPPA